MKEKNVSEISDIPKMPKNPEFFSASKIIFQFFSKKFFCFCLIWNRGTHRILVKKNGK